MTMIATSLMSSQIAIANENLTSAEDMSQLAFAFEKSTTLNHAPLSHAEMVETEGKVIPWLGYIGITGLARLAAPHVARYVASSAGTGALGGTGYAHIVYEDNNVPYSDRNYGRDAAIGAAAGTIGGIYGPLGAGAAGAYGSINYGYQPPAR